jgi:hypothetical protein
LTLDLSLEGVAIETRYPVGKGELLEVSMALKSGVVSFSGKVVYVQTLKGKKFNTGIRFEEISEQSRCLVGRYLSRAPSLTGNPHSHGHCRGGRNPESGSDLNFFLTSADLFFMSESLRAMGKI